MAKIFFLATLLACAPCLLAQSPTSSVDLKTSSLTMHIEATGFRFSLMADGKTVAAAHPESGLLIGGDPVRTAAFRDCSAAHCLAHVTTTNGLQADVTLALEDHHLAFTVVPADSRNAVLVRTAPVGPAFGLGDPAVVRDHADTDLTGWVDDRLHAGPYPVRLVSNFIIFPRQGFAELLVEPGVKMLHLTQTENAQGVPQAGPHGAQLHFFFGTPHQIYAAFKAVRIASGYPIDTPKYEMFGVGWEAFGALGWQTNQTTIRENVDHYLALGYPLKWIVIGSGFWPDGAQNQETTSFGLFDQTKYPQARELLAHFHAEGFKNLLGLRITFITDGPFAREGVEKGYFIQENGRPKVYKLSWPKSPSYLLDAFNPEALRWYLSLVKKWTDFGVDGFKEDFYSYGNYDLRDDKLDPVNHALMAQGTYLIERNGYLGSAGDLHRIEDFNYDQDQDRGPVDLMSLAYSGLPLAYPDIVGGTFGEGRFNVSATPRMEQYMMRNARWASLHSSMSMGQPPWTFSNPQVGQVMLASARLHERMHAYLYSQAVRFTHDGFPWPLTPLSLAFPQDPAVYGRENRTLHGYEWMIGDALLATPLYGNDYETATTRDIYLPAGQWMDYDTGRIYPGNQTLTHFPLPVEKTPLFIGGTGFVVETEGATLLGRAYPVTSKATTEFWAADSHTNSQVHINVTDWTKAKVFDGTTSQPIPAHWNRFALEFKLTPGHNYTIR